MRWWFRRRPHVDPVVARWLLASREGGPDRMTIAADGTVSYSYSDDGAKRARPQGGN